MNKQIFITTDFIKLDQLLKLASLVSGGGEAKTVIQSGLVIVNNDIETRRGRKLRNGDVVKFEDSIIEIRNDITYQVV